MPILQDTELCSRVPRREDQGGEGYRAACECPPKPCFCSELGALVYVCQLVGDGNCG